MLTESLTKLLVSVAKRLDRGLMRKEYQRRLHQFFLHYLIPFSQKQREYSEVFFSFDPVRNASVFLALKRLDTEKIDGVLAEVGVYRGDLSRIIHALSPNRHYYLFDTFEGFHPNDLHGEVDDRFRDTSLNLVKNNIGDLNNLSFRVGFFPDTAAGLESERFAFVMLDVDKYEPTLAGMQFFYPRMVTGGYIFVHDYNSPESNWGVSRAVDEFLAGKPEKLIELPDGGGSVVLRKQ